MRYIEGNFPLTSQAVAIFWAHFATLCSYLQSFRKFNPPILHPKKNFVRNLPRTGIWSTPKSRRRKDGTVSTPFLKWVEALNSSLFRFLWSSARCLDFWLIITRTVRFFISLLQFCA